MAKILDGLPKDEAETRRVAGIAARVTDVMLKSRKLGKRDRAVIDMMRGGLSMADICKITKDERDAVFAQGCRLLQVGEARKAQDMLLWLLRIEPTDERVIYALGAAYQAQGDHVTAGKFYVHFVALDALNPEGFLRLGECFFANQENEAARGAFVTAKILVEQGQGKPSAAAHADHMIALLDARSAATAA